jgi:hypothetical protein
MKCKSTQCHFPADPFSSEGYCNRCRAEISHQASSQRTTASRQRHHMLPRLPPLGARHSPRSLSASGPSMHHPSKLPPIDKTPKNSHPENRYQNQECLPSCKFCQKHHVSMAYNFKDASCLVKLLYQDSWEKEGYNFDMWKRNWQTNYGPNLDRCFPSIFGLLLQPTLSSIVCIQCCQYISISQKGYILDCVEHLFELHQR